MGFLLAGFIMAKVGKIKLYNSMQERILFPLSILIIGIVWDIFATLRHHWTFEGPGLIGWHIGTLPVEEYLFFLILPYFTLNLYYTIKNKLK